MIMRIARRPLVRKNIIVIPTAIQNKIKPHILFIDEGFRILVYYHTMQEKKYVFHFLKKKGIIIYIEINIIQFINNRLEG